MLIIEIHVDNHENKPASTRASKNREDDSTRSHDKGNSPIHTLTKAIKAWFKDRETNSSHTHGL